MAMRPIYLLCDSNIAGVGGHYLEYATMVLRAAESAGYQPVLATNRAFSGQVPESWIVQPVFEFDFWGKKPARLASEQEELSNLDRLWLRLRYSKMGLYWEAAGRPQELAAYTETYPLRESTVARLRDAACLRSGFEELDQGIYPKHQSTNAAENWTRVARDLNNARRRKLLKQVLKLQRAPLSGGDPATPAAAGGVLDSLALQASRVSSFQQSLEALLEGLSLGSDSHVLFPTMATFELRGLNALLEAAKGTARDPRYHVIMRRSIYSGYPEDAAGLQFQLHGWRSAFAIMNAATLDRRVAFYTDTAILTDQYDALSSIEFLTGPVPVDFTTRGRGGRTPSQGEVTWIFDADSPDHARAFLAALNARAGDFGGTRVRIYIVPGGDQGTMNYHAADLDGPQQVGWAEVLDSADLASVPLEACSALVVSGNRPRFEPLLFRAMDLGRPVVAPVGSRAASALAQLASTYHDEVLADAKCFERFSPSRQQWSQYDFGSGELSPFPDGLDLVVTVTPGTSTVIEMPMRELATHVRLTYVAHGHSHAIVFFRGSDREPLNRHDLPSPNVESKAGVIMSLVVPAPPGAENLSISLMSLNGDVRISDFSIAFLSTDCLVAALSGGLISTNLAGDIDNALITPAVNLVRNLAANAVAVPDAVVARRVASDGVLEATYLGDAREEKGYHHLPGVLTYLKTRTPHLQLKVQSYHSSHRPEPSCVVAQALLRAQSRDWASLIEEALPSDRYVRELSNTDIALIPYNRGNYIARSSGIFAEALAAGIPTVVPAGTWMSAVLDRLSADYHDAALQGSTLRAAEVTLLVWSNQDCQAFPTDSLPHKFGITRKLITMVELEIPDGTQYVWIRFKGDPERCRSFVRLDISFQLLQQEIARHARVVGGGLGESYSILVPVPASARRLWSGFYSAFTSVGLDLRDLTIDFVSDAPLGLPVVCGGESYLTEQNESDASERIAEAALEIARNHPGHLAACRWLQPRWAAENAPERLIEMTSAEMAKSRYAAASRFSGVDW